MNYSVDEKLLDHQAQNNQWFKSNCQVAFKWHSSVVKIRAKCVERLP